MKRETDLLALNAKTDMKAQKEQIDDGFEKY